MPNLLIHILNRSRPSGLSDGPGEEPKEETAQQPAEEQLQKPAQPETGSEERHVAVLLVCPSWHS